jgi:hypothetical protein
MGPIYNSMPLFKQVILTGRILLAKSWTSWYKQLKTDAIIAVIQNKHWIADETWCSITLRFKWMETLESLPPGISRCMWCPVFCKATNAVSDIAVCQHFKIGLKKMVLLPCKI